MTAPRRSAFDFVKTRKERWERLSQLCERVERAGLASLPVQDLRELGSLYRQAASDLAFAQSYFPESDLLDILNGLVARAHGHVYRARSTRLSGFLTTVLVTWPRAFRRNLGHFRAALVVFLFAVLLGGSASLADEKLASLFVSAGMLESIRRGEMWTDTLFQIIPTSLTASRIIINNLLVSYFVFGAGIAWGLGTIYALSMTGLLLGSVLALCFRYGMLLRLLDFICAHGILELSVFVMCGGAGLMLGEAVLAPGRLSRRDALRLRGPEAVGLVVMGSFFLVLAGLVESFISPMHTLPHSTTITQAKAAFGVLLGVVFYSYLFLCGRQRETQS